MPLSPQKVLDFQQAWKQVQIHAGLGVTEQNIDKVQLLVEQLNQIAIELYYEVYERPDLSEYKIVEETEESPLFQKGMAKKVAKQIVKEINKK